MRDIKRGNKTYLHHVHLINALVNVIIVFALCAVIIIFAYNYQRNLLIRDNYVVSNEVHQRYGYKLNNLWTVYMPLYAWGDPDSELLNAFKEFAESNPENMKPMLRSSLITALRRMASVDSDIVSIALCNKNAPDFLCVYSRKDDTFKIEARQIDYHDGLMRQVEAGAFKRVLIGGYRNSPVGEYRYAISGGLPESHDGSTIISFSATSLNNIVSSKSLSIKPRVVIVSREGQVVYDSCETLYGTDGGVFANISNAITIDSLSYYVENVKSQTSAYSTYCLNPIDELNKLSHQYSPLIVGVCSLCAIASLALHMLASMLSSRRVKTINNGIGLISNNNLCFRFDINEQETNDEFTSIERAINSMVESTEKYISDIKRVSRLRMNAELNEIQAKFNPHFLYNTLESIRVKLQESGDDESAGLIRLLARIFEAFVKGAPFVTLQDEISFINVYLEIYRRRYENSFKVYYDIEPAIREYGIIRNLLQPIIENYFSHGFKPSRSDNVMRIAGCLGDDGLINISIENNGFVIDEARIKQIHDSLLSPDTPDAGFGLAYINKRLKMFYGAECGLVIESTHKHTITRIRLRPMTLEEHKRKMEALADDEVDIRV